MILSFEPSEPMPLLLLGIRDELTGRPWRPPARHWPGSPLIGGIDDLAGGTWLALSPGVPRVACLLNGRGPLADPARRRSRGELPLRAADEGSGFLRELADDPGALAAYDPFHLICATQGEVTQLSWPGSPPAAPDPAAQPAPPSQSPQLAAADPPAGPGTRAMRGPVLRRLGPGTHMVTNVGHAYPADPAFPLDPVGEPKAIRFAGKFAASRPSADPALPLAAAWGDWLTLAAGDGLDRADPRAIIVGRALPDGRVYGTTSVTLVGLAPGALRYDFQPEPGGCSGWYPVDVPSMAARTRPASPGG